MDSVNPEKKLHARDGDRDGLELEEMACFDEIKVKEEPMDVSDVWLETDNQEHLLDINEEVSIFCEDFPPIPEFPCMSSSSSSSPPDPIALIPVASSSASSSSSPAALSSTASMELSTTAPSLNAEEGGCMDVVEDFGCMDLIDCSDIWDPSSLLELEQPPQEFFSGCDQNDVNEVVDEQGPSDELGVVFFEWLRSNKEFISAEDMRSIKLKRSTVECASKRLGSSKEGKKQLLKLILEWVEKNQLQKKRLKSEAASQSQLPSPCPEQIFQNPNLSYNSISPPLSVTPAVGYRGSGDLFAPVPHISPNLQGLQNFTPGEYRYTMTSHYIPFPENYLNATMPPHPQAFLGYNLNDQYPYQYYQGNVNGETTLVRFCSSATKEARKKRMARQKRLAMHHRHNQQQQNNRQSRCQNQNVDHQQVKLGGQNCTNPTQANWVYWQSPTPASAATTPAPLAAASDQQVVPKQPVAQTQAAPPQQQRRQGWKAEKMMNLRFLLQKVLKQSDVGNLGRIVLPKKEAEAHLPLLEVRDGITIPMEDIATSQVWNMRYRFWPNNKSRMYLLENTGDFVRANGLREGDFIVLYSDVKTGKYLIRGVKVRQPAGGKPDTKKPAKGQRNQRTASPVANGSLSLPQPQKE
ncbi:hypothetical protein NMG60_11014191 [Bertholletia excelsa]